MNDEERGRVDQLVDVVMALHFQLAPLRDGGRFSVENIDALCDRMALLSLPFMSEKYLKADGIEIVSKALLAIPLEQRVQILGKVVQAMPVEEFTSIFRDRCL